MTTSAAAGPAASRLGRDLAVTMVALLAVAAWDFSGLDLAATRWIATPEGFPWREHVLTSRVLHQGGRVACGVLLVLLLIDALRPWIAGPTRAQRWRALAAILACLVLIPALKQVSNTSCPWDLAEFGGRAPYVPHWLLGTADGGPGHCFPSGHATAAFAFFALYFAWRPSRPRLARGALVATLVAGALLGWAQWARGAHFVSHTLWSAWLCWVTCAAFVTLQPRRRYVALQTDPH